MKIGYLLAGAFLEWVIRTKEGKDFANKIISKGYCLVKDNLSDVLSESKSRLATGMDGNLLSSSGRVRDNKSISQSGTQGESRDSSGTSAPR